MSKLFALGGDTLLMLDQMVEEDGSDESKIISDLICREWKSRNGIVEVPIIGKLDSKTMIAVGKQGPMFDGRE